MCLLVPQEKVKFSCAGQGVSDIQTLLSTCIVKWKKMLNFVLTCDHGLGSEDVQNSPIDKTVSFTLLFHKFLNPTDH